MSWRPRWSGVLVAVAALLVMFPASAQSDVFTWSGTLANGQRLEVIDINGSIDVVPSGSNLVDVRAEKTVRRGSASDVEIKVEQESGGLVVCTLYRRGDGTVPSGCRDDRKSRGQNSNNHEIKVTYTIRMPAGANLAAKTVNGSVEVRGLMADVHASTVNGGVTLETTGRATASTVNGNVNATVGLLDRDSKFSTVNGKIVIAVGSSLNADVEISTVNGKIETDLPITIQGTMSRRSLKGRIGNGGPRLVLSTVNGSIRIEKSSVLAPAGISG